MLYRTLCFRDDGIPVGNIEYGQHGNDQTQNDVQLNNTDNIVNNNVEDGVFEVENSLVQFSDLKKSQKYVTDMHDIMFTDRKTQKK